LIQSYNPELKPLFYPHLAAENNLSSTSWCHTHSNNTSNAAVSSLTGRYSWESSA